MACETCQDCSCDNVTLPVVTGPTGATGATGAAGADGSDGVTVLHNDTTQGTTASASFAVFSNAKAYTAPINTLATNGSKFKVTALFSTTGAGTTGASEAEFQIGGSSWTAKTDPYNIPHSASDTQFQMRVELDLVRTSTTNLLISCRVETAHSDGQIFKHRHFFEATNTVADLSANTLLIDVRGKTSGATTFNCDQLEVVHYVK